MASSPPTRRERLRLDSHRIERGSDGRCRALVVLGWTGDRRYEGRARGLSTLQGELRCSAEAAVEAIRRAVGPAVSLELMGLKAVRAFDGTVVIASLRVRAEGETTRLLGASAVAEDERGRGAVLAVLDATNRVLAPHIGAP